MKKMTLIASLCGLFSLSNCASHSSSRWPASVTDPGLVFDLAPGVYDSSDGCRMVVSAVPASDAWKGMRRAQVSGPQGSAGAGRLEQIFDGDTFLSWAHRADYCHEGNRDRAYAKIAVETLADAQTKLGYGCGGATSAVAETFALTLTAQNEPVDLEWSLKIAYSPFAPLIKKTAESYSCHGFKKTQEQAD